MIWAFNFFLSLKKNEEDMVAYPLYVSIKIQDSTLHCRIEFERVECSQKKLHRNHDEPVHILFNWFLSERVSLSTFYLIVKHTLRAGNTHLIVRDSHFNIPATWNSHHIYWQSSVKIINFLFRFWNFIETNLKLVKIAWIVFDLFSKMHWNYSEKWHI